MTIRPAGPEDNDRLQALEQDAPQGSAVRLLTERRHFSVRADRFQDPILMIDEAQPSGMIRGVMGIGPVRVTLNGQPANGGLLFDWRSNSKVNSGLDRHMYHLWQAVKKEAISRRIDFVFGHVKEDNQRSLHILTRSGARIVDTIDFLTLPVHRAYCSKRSLVGVKVETTFDARHEWSLVRSRLKGHSLLPEPDPTQRSQQLMDQYVPAVLRRSASSLKILDTSADYRHQVISIPAHYRMAAPLFRTLSAITPMPHVPSPGETIREWYLYDLMVDHPDDLFPLLETARQLAVRRQVDYLIIGVHPADPTYRLLKSRAWLKLPYHVLYMPLAPGFQDVPEAPVYFDVRYL